MPNYLTKSIVELCLRDSVLISSLLSQSMSVALPPGLAVSVLKAIFQEIHVQVSDNSCKFTLLLVFVL